MKKWLLCLALSGVFLYGTLIHANAALFTEEDESLYGKWDNSFNGYWSDTKEWSGYFIGLFNGNDSQADLEDLAEKYLDEALDDVIYDKVDPVPAAGVSTGEDGYLKATATFWNEDDEPIAGTWSITSPYALGFYAVKGGSEWGLYYVNPYQSEGFWSTVHLKNGGGKRPEISHLSGLVTATAVPEPTTILLLGTGLVGFAGAGIRKRMKK